MKMRNGVLKRIYIVYTCTKEVRCYNFHGLVRIVQVYHLEHHVRSCYEHGFLPVRAVLDGVVAYILWNS